MRMFLLSASRSFFKKEGLFLASGLAFDLLVSCIPFLFLVASGIGFFFSKFGLSFDWFQDLIKNLLPAARQAFIQDLSTLIANRKPFGLIGFLFFFIFTSSMFGSVRIVLDRIFELNHERHYLVEKGFDLLVMLISSALFILAVGIESILLIVRRVGGKFHILGAFLDPGWTVLSSLLGLLFTVSLFFVLYRFCPSKKVGVKVVLISTLTGTLLFEVSKPVFAWYMTISTTYPLLFGTLAGLLFFILWIYYSCLIFILSAVIGKTLGTTSLSP